MIISQMHRFVPALVSTLCLVLVSCSPAQQDAETTDLAGQKTITVDVDPAAAQQALQADPTVQIVDVRTPGEYSSGHLQGARLVDYHGPDFRAQIEALDRARPCLVYCASGGRSRKALKLFQSLGFEQIIHLPGGFSAWQQARLPVAK